MSFLKRLRGRRSAPSLVKTPPPTPAPPANGPLDLGVPEPDAVRELLLYKFDACPFCVRVMRAAEGLGVDLPYADIRRDPAARQTMLDRTGRTQVPCLFVDDQPLFESADINRWIRRYAENGFGG